jgi:hypothetical protein
LRILVLGNGAAAEELRRQAAEAGAELAQRFSARVTHVVTEPGLGADDPRVAKALAADLPVLGVDECVQLLGFCEVPGAAALIPPQPVEAPKKRAAAKAKGTKGAGKAGSGGDHTSVPALAPSPEAEAGDWSKEETEAEAKAELGLPAGAESAMEPAAVLADGLESGSGQAGLAGGERMELGEDGAAGETEVAVREPLSVVDVQEVVAEGLLGAAEMPEVSADGLIGRVEPLEVMADEPLSGIESLEVVAGEPLSGVGPLEGPAGRSLSGIESLEGTADGALSAVERSEGVAGELLGGDELLEAAADGSVSAVAPLEDAVTSPSVIGARASVEVEEETDRAGLGELAGHADFNSVASEDRALSGVGKVSDGSSAYSPMESMLGSALEAALLFPPLPVSASESLTLDSDYLIDSYPDAPAITESEQPVDRIRSAGLVGWAEQAGQVEQAGRLGKAGRIADVTGLAEVTETTAVGLTEAGSTSTSTSAGIGASASTDPKRNGSNAGTSDSDSDSDSMRISTITATRNSDEEHGTPDQPAPAPHAGLTTDIENLETATTTDGEPADLHDNLDAPDNPANSDPTKDRARAVASYAWAAIPFASLGLLTPVAMGYAAYRQRSRALGAVAAWYLFAVTIAFAISATATDGSRTQSGVGDLLTICLAASWIGGTVHALLIRRQVFGRSE